MFLILSSELACTYWQTQFGFAGVLLISFLSQNPFLIAFFYCHVICSTVHFFLLFYSSSKAEIFTHPIPSDFYVNKGLHRRTIQLQPESFLITDVSKVPANFHDFIILQLN